MNYTKNHTPWLIDAAPEMLSVLKMLLADAELRGVDTQAFPYNIVRSVIAKAEGKAQEG